MNANQPGHPGRDADPTGVRELLASLPDPGPMPEDVAARIHASIAAEQHTREAAVAAGGLSHDLGLGQVTPLARRERPRRPVWLVLGSAAAAVAAVGLVGTALLRVGPSGSIGTEAAVSAGSAAGAGPQDLQGKAAPAAGLLHIQLSTTDYTTATLPRQAAALLGTPGPTVDPGAAAAPGVGPIATTAGLQSCLEALGDADALRASADIAMFEGQPAALIVVTKAGGTKVYAVRRDCREGDPGILHDAMPVG